MSSDSRDEEYIQQGEWQGHEEGEMQRGEEIKGGRWRGGRP